MMGYTAKELVAIAQAEIGYKEKASNSNLDSKSGNSGSNNYTKYARDLYNAGYYNGNKQGQAWCDMFVDWCFYQLCGKNKAKAEAMECQTGDLGAGCTYSKQYYNNAGRLSSTPKVGDQVFYKSGGKISHTGIVETVSSSQITTIEGNSGNQVKRHTYSRSNSYIDSYGHPKYDDTSSSTSTTSGTTTTKKTDEEYTATLSVDGEWGKKTTKRLQTVMGTEVDGLIDGQDSKQKKYWLGILSETCKWSGGTSPMVKAWQKYLIGKGYSCGTCGADGEFGKDTAKASQKFLIAKGYSCGKDGADGLFEKNSVSAIQNWLNDQK